jgi:nitronate monooxygenase
MGQMTQHGWADALGLETPIVQAPMAGGPTTADLVAAVSNAGGLGSLGAAYLAPDVLDETIRAIRAKTDRPFAVNLFAGGYEEAHRPVDPAPMLELMAAIHAELGLPAPPAPPLVPDPYDGQLEVILDSRPAVFSFTFGMPPAGDLVRLRAAGITVVGTATTVDEARRLAAAGVDAIVAQGGEAGGHRGTFAARFEDALIPLRELTASIVDAVDTPVIAAGALMDAADVVGVLALGAQGAALGTAFLATPESGASAAQKAAILATDGDPTLVTRAFSGRPARAMANEFTHRIHGRDDILLPYPQQNTLTRPMRTAAARAGDPRWLSMYAGTGVARARAIPAADLVRELAAGIPTR